MERPGGLAQILLAPGLEPRRLHEVLEAAIDPFGVLQLHQAEAESVLGVVGHETNRLAQHLDGGMKVIFLDELPGADIDLRGRLGARLGYGRRYVQYRAT